MVLAATFPFRRVIGVEISEALQAMARRKRGAAHGRNCSAKNIELVTCDAAEYEIPDDVIAIYFFNPFYASVLSNCLAQIRRIVDAAGREN